MARDRSNDHRSAFAVQDAEEWMERIDAMRVFAIALGRACRRMLTDLGEADILAAGPRSRIDFVLPGLRAEFARLAADAGS